MACTAGTGGKLPCRRMTDSGPDDRDNPLLDASAAAWDRLLDRLGPASMLVCIEARMGARLRQHLTAEDIWQETLLHMWRDRAKVEWRGYPALRQWVLGVAENRIRNATDRLDTARRGGGRASLPLRDAEGSHGDDQPPPATSTTPSGLAVLREQAAAMREALTRLPEELREVVRLRLFEELPVADVAARLGLGESAVKHRFRRGAALYEAHLREFATRRDT